MIEVTEGNILNNKAEALVNTVNCVGAMGRGVALQFRRAFPDNYQAYTQACKANEVQIGKMFIFNTEYTSNPHYIINFPTKKDWKHKSTIQYIKSGLEDLVRNVKELGIKSIAIPPLGCGLGGLKWEEVKPLIEEAFIELPLVQVYLFEPSKIIFTGSILKEGNEPKMSPTSAGLIGLMHSYLLAAMDISITLLEIHKLMYLYKETQPINLKNLRFTEAPYGPYSTNLRHILNELEGYFIRGYDGEDAPKKNIELTSGAIEKAQAYLKTDTKVAESFQKVIFLIEGFETGYGMELLSSVHWVIVHNEITSPPDIITAIHNWSPRKKDLFKEEDILLAIKVLKEKHWFNPHHESHSLPLFKALRQ